MIGCALLYSLKAHKKNRKEGSKQDKRKEWKWKQVLFIEIDVTPLLLSRRKIFTFVLIQSRDQSVVSEKTK